MDGPISGDMVPEWRRNAYAAVWQSPFLTTDASINARIWHAVECALNDAEISAARGIITPDAPVAPPLEPRGRARRALHGGSGTLYNRGCRCDRCKEGHRARMARSRARRNVEDYDGPHGLRSVYNNWGCRCQPCTEAHSAACAEYARRRKAKEARNA